MGVLFLCMFTAWFSGEARLLQLNLNVGDRWIEEEVLDMSHHVEGVPGKSVTKAKSRQRFHVVSGPDEGVYKIKVTFESFEEHELTGLNPMDFSKLLGKSFMISQNMNGKVLDVEPPEGLDQDQKQVFQFYKQRYLTDSLEAYFPKKEVKPHDSWANDLSITMDVNGIYFDHHIQLNCRFEGMEDKNGRESVKLAFKGTSDGQINQGSFGSTNGEAEGFMWLDPNHGFPYLIESKGVYRMDLITPMGNQKAIFNMKSTRIRLDDEAVQ